MPLRLTAVAAILLLPRPATAQGVPECWRFEGTTFPTRIYHRDTQRFEVHAMKALRLLPVRLPQSNDSTVLRVVPLGVDSIGLLAVMPSYWQRVSSTTWTVHWKEADEDRVLELHYNGSTLQGRYTAVGNNEALAEATVRAFAVSCGGSNQG